MDKVIAMDSELYPSEFLKEITDKLLIDRSSVNQNSTLFGSLRELACIKSDYKNKINRIKEHGRHSFDHYLPEIKALKIKEKEIKISDFIFETLDLNVLAASYIIWTKICLDKLIPLYDVKHGTTLKKFSKAGKSLINSIHNKNKPLEGLILSAKSEWIDEVIDLRNEIVHYSNIEKIFRGFRFNMKDDPVPKSFKDLKEPSYIIHDKEVEVFTYMQSNFTSISDFVLNFLVLSGYSREM